MDALGIRDVITAMGIQGDAFKDASLDFKSQFSEKSHCQVSCGDDSTNISVSWTDRDGKEGRLSLRGETDVIKSLGISRTK